MSSTANATPPIWAKDLEKRFGATVAVDGLGLAVERGTCLGLLGPNGAGKTTTIEMLEGLTAPDHGEVSILGFSWKRDAARIRAGIGVQLQETTLPDKLRVAEILRAFASFYRTSRTVDEVLEIVGLGEKRGALVSELSGGQRQRLSLGCALVHRPEVLFLDEPTTGLDPQARRRVWEVVEEFKRGGGTVLLTTHYMEEAERLADELLIIDHGKSIASGPPRAIVASLGAEIILELHIASANGDPSADAPEVALDDATLRALPGVTSVGKVDQCARIGAKSLERTLPALLETLAARGLTLADLAVHRPTLEDVFVSLTGRQLRDA